MLTGRDQVWLWVLRS